MIPDNFREWACSLSGCDGGDIDVADIWVCGIEPGYGSYEDGKYYREDLPKEIAQGKYEPDQEKYDWPASLRYTYGRSLAKLYTAIQGQEVGGYKEFIAGCNGSEVFKLNLYPIAFDSTDPKRWQEFGLEAITGFSEKYLFQTWCFLNRFPAISALVEEKKPRLIIGTGVGYLRDFLVCFGGGRTITDEIQSGEIEAASEANRHVKRRYYWVQLNPATTLVVVPFLSGPSGLNSDYLIQEMGKRIADLE